MAKTKVPDKLKIKLVLEVDKTLYDRIVEQAKAENLPGTIEDVLKQCCLGWFKGWENIFAAMDNPQPIVTPTRPPGLLGPNGRPMGRA
jgi:hypothetical protein